MGEKSPLDPSLLASVNRLRNVLVYVDGNSEIVLCDNMDPNIIFKDGETYTIVLSSNSAAPAPQPQPQPPAKDTNVATSLLLEKLQGKDADAYDNEYR